jgi:AcrR family transcriptional regulator
MPKIVDKEKMKNDILQATLAAFLKYGFHNTTMTIIAKQAKIAKGTLYLYFDSKESLTQTIAERHFEKLKHQLMPDKPFATLNALLLHIENALIVSDEESQFIPVFFEAFGPSFTSEPFVEKYQNFFDEIGDFYQQSFKYLIEKNEIDSDMNPNLLGRILVSMLDGIVLHKGFFKIPNEAHKSMVKEAVRLFKRGLKT